MVKLVFRLIATGLMVLLLGSSSMQGRDRQAARDAYGKARANHTKLLELPVSERSSQRFEQAIFLYRRVVDHDPTYGASDDALFAIASLYEKMANRFNSLPSRRRAIYYYQFLAREYPLTKHQALALTRAKALINSKASRINWPANKLEAVKPQKDLATVSEIRYWSSDDYTRVVVQLDREVEFAKGVLNKPARIYFDLHDARLKPELQGTTYSPDDLFIREIRVAQNSPQVVRVVLDSEKINKHTVFALYDPFRIVIDTTGGIPVRKAHVENTENKIETEVTEIPPKQERPTEVANENFPNIPSPNLGGDRSLTRVLGLKVGRVVIDPGHGGHDTGTVGSQGLREKDLVLEISLRLKALLKENLVTEVVLTRETDKFVPLEERTAIANQLGADLFLSIHANSSRNQHISGAETFYLNFSSNPDEREVASRENAGSQKNIRDLENLLKQIALGDYNEESRDFAHIVQEHLHNEIQAERTRFRDRGVKRAAFIVLINLNMPGILTEVGFISNPSEESFLSKETTKNSVAHAIYTGIEQYFKSLGITTLRQQTVNTENP